MKTFICVQTQTLIPSQVKSRDPVWAEFPVFKTDMKVRDSLSNPMQEHMFKYL